MPHITDLFTTQAPRLSDAPEKRFVVVGERPMQTKRHYWQRFYPRLDTLSDLYRATKDELIAHRSKLAEVMAPHFDELKIIDRMRPHELTQPATLFLVNTSATFASMTELKNAANQDNRKIYDRFTQNGFNDHAYILSFVGQFGERSVLLRPESKILVLEADSGAIIYGSPLYLNENNTTDKQPIRQKNSQHPNESPVLAAFKKRQHQFSQ